MTSAVVMTLLTAGPSAWAQKRAPAGEQPAISTSADSPAVNTAPDATSPVGKTGPKNGTTIVGDRESPIGLYITPWRNAAAEIDIDRPARLLAVGLDPMDRKVFMRQIDYYEALTAAQKAKVGVAPAPAP